MPSVMMLNTIVVLIFGMIIGSFLNVCIYRIPKGESIIYPGSHCMACKHALNKLDLIPVLSFLYLKGKCRYCGKKISMRYMLVELITGLLFAAVYVYFGFSLFALRQAVFIAVLIVLTMIDYDHMLLPTRIILFGAMLGLIIRMIQATLYKDIGFLMEGVLAGLLAYILFYSAFYLAKLLFKKEGLGFGDVRLIGMIGIYLSAPLVLFTILIASVIASIYGIVLLYIKKTSEPFAFGPFINMGAVIALFYGKDIIIWYLTISGR